MVDIEKIKNKILENIDNWGDLQGCAVFPSRKTSNEQDSVDLLAKEKECWGCG